jgi:hypothetical protein
MMVVTNSSKTPVLARAEGSNIPEGGILHSQRHENFKTYRARIVFHQLYSIL